MMYRGRGQKEISEKDIASAEARIFRRSPTFIRVAQRGPCIPNVDEGRRRKVKREKIRNERHFDRAYLFEERALEVRLWCGTFLKQELRLQTEGKSRTWKR